MITNFELLTNELDSEEIRLIEILIAGFKKRRKGNPIKAADVVSGINFKYHKLTLKKKLTQVRLRKMVNLIRVKGLLPLIGTSNGYFVTNSHAEIEKQIKSLTERANSIKSAANGLQNYLNELKSVEQKSIFNGNN